MRSPLYVIEQGSRLTREGRRVLVVKEGGTLAQVAVLQVSQVIVFGNVQITTPALRLLLDEGIEVVLLSETGRFYGRLVGATNGNGALRVNQVLRSQDATFTLHTAQQMVRGKLHNVKSEDNQSSTGDYYLETVFTLVSFGMKKVGRQPILDRGLLLWSSAIATDPFRNGRKTTNPRQGITTTVAAHLRSRLH